MAKSPSHEFGQIIGNVLETAIEPLLQQFADDHNLYLDKKGPRPARSGKKVTWIDSKGNKHDLDFVLERGGTDNKIGTPIAFIETAWRRYTKHSRNKAQEIQGAILPLISTYQEFTPFPGVILAGVFTEGALAQLKSHNFNILYFTYDTVISAFSRSGINAHFDEETPDAEFKRKIRSWKSLSDERKITVAKALLENNKDDVQTFMNTLNQTVTRQIKLVRIIPLHGTPFEWHTVTDAVKFVESYNESNASVSLQVIKYEVEIRYNNGDQIRGEFEDKNSALQFLCSFEIHPLVSSK